MGAVAWAVRFKSVAELWANASNLCVGVNSTEWIALAADVLIYVFLTTCYGGFFMYFVKFLVTNGSLVQFYANWIVVDHVRFSVYNRIEIDSSIF